MTDLTEDEINKQIAWHEQVISKVLKETGCILTHQALVIVVREFSDLVKQKQGEQDDGKPV